PAPVAHGPPFPTRRSSDLAVEPIQRLFVHAEPLTLGRVRVNVGRSLRHLLQGALEATEHLGHAAERGHHLFTGGSHLAAVGVMLDRKSTRLNSSHVKISYA